MPTLTALGFPLRTSSCVAVVLVVVATHCVAVEPACADTTLAKLRLHDFGQRLTELTAVQRGRAEAVKALVSERGQLRGWSEARQSEVITEYLASGPYVVLQAKRAPNDLVIDRIKNVLRGLPSEETLRVACNELQSAMAAVEENFQINERLYELARKYIEEVQ